MSGGGTAGGRIAPGVGANLIGQHAQDRNQDATVYMGNLDPQAILLQKICMVLYRLPRAARPVPFQKLCMYS